MGITVMTELLVKMVLVSKLRPLRMQAQQAERQHQQMSGLPQFQQLQQVVISGLRLSGPILTVRVKQAILLQ
ncbi:hypothetical protein CRM88_13735 [Lactococcus lactis]|nr:hypothetical protein B8W94_13350 [Lactococcus lactis]PEN17506.1 hypothetical protein CRM88_13735 [Lactococcus lactis]